MLKVRLILFITLFIQVHSWKNCSNPKCFLEETFQNCDAFDECIISGIGIYKSVMDYYSRAYNVHEANQQDIDGLQLDKLHKLFDIKVDAGFRRCRHFKNSHNSITCKTRWPQFDYSNHYNSIKGDLKRACKEVQLKLISACETARKNLMTLSSCDINHEFEKQVVKRWTDCINLDNV